MDDRCTLQIEFLKKDLPAFNKILKEQLNYPDNFWRTEGNDIDMDNDVFWAEYTSDNDDIIEAIIYEANYGWHDELLTLAKAGLTFTGEHDGGGTYSSENFACFKGDYKEIPTLSNDSSCPMIPIFETGIQLNYVADALEYFKIRKQATDYIYDKEGLAQND